jgi:uncharacterized protein RhaS with RHS repeats
MGRWINRDPIGERGGINLYTFALNQPVNVVDFLGNVSFSTDKAACTITATLSITFSADLFDPAAATLDARANQMKQAIESAWSGKKVGCCTLNVVVDVSTSVLRQIFSRDDKIELQKNPNELSHVYPRLLGGYNGIWDSDEPDVVSVHEAGHLLGLDDQYVIAPDGTPWVIPGQENSMMGDPWNSNGVVGDDEAALAAGLNGVECPCGSK